MRCDGRRQTIPDSDGVRQFGRSARRHHGTRAPVLSAVHRTAMPRCRLLMLGSVSIVEIWRYRYNGIDRTTSIPFTKLFSSGLLLLLMTFIGRKLRHAATAPSQPLHDNSYPRTGTFSVVSWTVLGSEMFSRCYVNNPLTPTVVIYHWYSYKASCARPD